MRALGEASGEIGTGAPEDEGALDLGATLEVSEDIEIEAEDTAYEDGAISEDLSAYEAPSRRGWIAPAAAIFAALAWTGFYVWAMRGSLVQSSALAPSDWVRVIIDWSIPVVLIGVVWVIAMRNSRAEASRFARSAALLSQESQQLEHRLLIVNRELSLAREFLASQSLELESLGRIASDRISQHASELQGLIRDNGEQVDRIGTASESALANMASLRDDLPVIANSARDVTNQIGNTGRTAKEQLDELVSGFERLNEFGHSSEARITALNSIISSALTSYETQLEAIGSTTSERFANLQSEAEAYRNQVTDAETAALAATSDRVAALQSETQALSESIGTAQHDASGRLRSSLKSVEEEITQMIDTVDKIDQAAKQKSKERISELHDEAVRFDEMLATHDARFTERMEQRQAEFDTRETQASELLAQRLAELDEALSSRRESQIAETAKLVEHGRALGSELEAFNILLAQIGKSSEATRAGLSSGMEALEQQLAAKRAALAETEARLASVTDASVRLLEIVQSGAQQSREVLPEAIDTAAERLRALETRATDLSGLMLQTTQQGSQLGDYLTVAQGEVEKTDTAIGALQAKIDQHADDAMAKLQGLRGGLDQLAKDGETFAGETQEQLRTAIGQLDTAIEAAFTTLDEGARSRVSHLAASLSDEAVKALERSLRNEAAETVGALEQAAAHASGVGREATIQLRDQLAKVNELTGNLEQRIARARELAEEQVNNDFARRMALITDSLNSSAIDITGAIGTEVSDTAWDAYLKGDRGIFTRRAVRLIDNGQAREIAELYQNDDAFKANVSRYIHDFEAMLRSMLSTRDGKALSVTVLGSDMGKLYVLLAQAIERFRN